MNPARKLAAAMPGTLVELSARTGYPVATILNLIRDLRVNGTRVTARRDPTVTGVPARAKPEPGMTTTVFDIIE